jgi:hypothetical protein
MVRILFVLQEVLELLRVPRINVDEGIGSEVNRLSSPSPPLVECGI